MYQMKTIASSLNGLLDQPLEKLRLKLSKLGLTLKLSKLGLPPV